MDAIKGVFFYDWVLKNYLQSVIQLGDPQGVTSVILSVVF